MPDIEEELKKNNAIKIKPRGYSMYPVIVPGRDEVIIEPVSQNEKYKRGDVILYRREGDILVLHRICKVKSDGIYCVGDNQEEIEGPILQKQIKGKLAVIIRKGTQIPVTNFCYKGLCGIWLILRPFRKIIKNTAAFIKRIIKSSKGNN